jgi:hypothetical protein
VIDGSVEEWNENEMVFLEKQDVMVGVANDDEYLYISFYSTSRERAMQLMQSGFTIWLNAKGKKKDFGIRYPIRVYESMEKPMADRNLDSQKMNKQSDTEDARNEFLEKLDENLVIIDGKDEKEYKIEYIEDIQVAYTFDREMFMYELKIPLTEDNHKYSIEPTNKNVIYTGIETEEVTRPKDLPVVGDRADLLLEEWVKDLKVVPVAVEVADKWVKCPKYRTNLKYG